MSCPNCPCHECVGSRASPFRREDEFTDYGTPGPAPGVDRWTGAKSEPECMFDRIAREYEARNQPMPTGWLLHCPCKRCNPITF